MQSKAAARLSDVERSAGLSGAWAGGGAQRASLTAGPNAALNGVVSGVQTMTQTPPASLPSELEAASADLQSQLADVNQQQIHAVEIKTSKKKQSFWRRVVDFIPNIFNAVFQTAKALVGTIVSTLWNFLKDGIGGLISNLAKGNIGGACAAVGKAVMNGIWNVVTGALTSVMVLADPIYQLAGGSQPPVKVQWHRDKDGNLHTITRGGIPGEMTENEGAGALTKSQLDIWVNETDYRKRDPIEKKALLEHELTHTRQLQDSYVVDNLLRYDREEKKKGYCGVKDEQEAYKVEDQYLRDHGHEGGVTCAPLA